MIKSKFFDVFKTFSKEDHKKFGQFINSDYFNSSIFLRKLYAVIVKYAPGLSGEKLTRENLFEELYPGKKYREGTIVNLLSGLYKLSEDYIAQKIYEADPLKKEVYLLKGLTRRKLNKFVAKSYKETMNEMNKTLIRDADYFHRRHEIEYQYMSFLSGNDRGYNLNKEPIQNYYDNLIEYIIVKLLSIHAFMLNQKVYVNEDNFDMSFLEYIFKYLDENSFRNKPTISIYFNLLKLIKEDDEQYFFKLKELMSAYPAIIDGNELRNIYVNMINFCTFKSRVSGISRFTRETFGLFKFVVENKIYMTEENTKLDHILYLGVVTTGLDIKEFDWVESFISQAKEELVEEHKDNTYNLCYALFNFSRKNYEKSLEYLSKVQRMHVFFNLQINTLTLQNYYELNLFDNAFSIIDSYKHYLKENPEITTFNVKRTKDFLDTVNKLIKIKSGQDKYDAAEFNLSLEVFSNILKKNWIIEKIEEIKKNY